MASQVAGNIVLDEHTILDINSVPLSGMLVPGDVTLTLLRQSGQIMVAASESPAWAEIGSTGRYFFTFFPQNTGLYYLELKELNVNSLQRVMAFRYDIYAAGAVNTPSYQNAFCAESDVERYLLQPIDATTKPSDTQAAAFAEGRAARLMSLIAGLGGSVTPSTVIAGSRLEDLLREANAIGAALDCTVAQVFSTSKLQTEKVISLIAAWVALAGGYDGATYHCGDIEREIKQNTVSLASSHILSGDTLARPSEGTPQDSGLQIRMGDLF